MDGDPDRKATGFSVQSHPRLRQAEGTLTKRNKDIGIVQGSTDYAT